MAFIRSPRSFTALHRSLSSYEQLHVAKPSRATAKKENSFFMSVIFYWVCPRQKEMPAGGAILRQACEQTKKQQHRSKAAFPHTANIPDLPYSRHPSNHMWWLHGGKRRKIKSGKGHCDKQRPHLLIPTRNPRVQISGDCTYGRHGKIESGEVRCNNDDRISDSNPKPAGANHSLRQVF